MATRAAVIMNDSVGMRGVYSHWDGYLAGLGAKLKNFFNTRDKVETLIDGGDIAEIDDFGGVRYFEAGNPLYKGETWQEVAKQIPHNGHIYVNINGIWYWAESTKTKLYELDSKLEEDDCVFLDTGSTTIDDVHDWISGKVGGGRDD